jgi:2,4-dienoyl-CoA reductase-like NADH-dependent reductase (Old Yellow Enzyme family)
MPHLLEPLTVRGVTLRNRVGVSPMCQYSSENGLANDWHLAHLGARAAGGAGLVHVEATAVSDVGRISPGDMGLWSAEHVEPLARVARFVKSQGAVAAIQLAHAGRKASMSVPWEGDRPIADADGGWTPLAPSAVPFDDGWRVPKAMTVDDIAAVVRQFRDAAERAVAAGFEWLELHYAHGYLVHSFLSPIANKRSDDYGGSFDDRCRVAVEIVRAVRRVWPQRLPLAARLSCSDWRDVEGDGWTLEDSIALAKRLAQEGVDLIDCSSGGIAPRVKIPVAPGYQVQFADAIKREVEVLTAAVGMITEPKQANDIVAGGRADMVNLAREMLRDPNFAIRAARALGHAPPVPKQYARAWAGPPQGTRS